MALSFDATQGGGWRIEERPLEEQVALPEGTVPALVDPATWQAVQARFARNKAEAPRNNRDPEASLLRGGYVRCGYCGNSVIAFVHKAAGLMYRCCVYSRDVPGCRSSAVLVKHLDAAVWKKVEAVITHPDVIALQVERLGQASTLEADLASIERQRVAIEKQRQRIARAVAALEDDEAAAPLLTELRMLAAQSRQLDADQITALDRLASWQAEKDRLAGLQEWCRRVAGNLPKLSYAQKRDLLAALDVRVTLYQKNQPTPRWVITMSPDDVVYGTSWPFSRLWR